MEWLGIEMGRDVRTIVGEHGSCPPVDRLGPPALRLGRMTVVCPCAFSTVNVKTMYRSVVEHQEMEDPDWVARMRTFADAGLL